MGNIYSYFPHSQDVSSSLGLSMMEWRTKSLIRLSKRHWSIVPKFAPAEEELAKASNVDVFKELQGHSKWGSFFYTFEEGELVIGKRFAKGGQGKLYEAQIIWRNPNWRELFQREDVQKYPDAEYVLKVFKKGNYLEGLKSQWPEGLLQFHAHKEDAWGTRRYACNVVCGTLLPNGCFAFVLQREHADLRILIERYMASRKWALWTPWTIWLPHFGPFSKEVSDLMMYEVALGVDWLHKLDIVHRDLKASNVLVRKENDRYYCFVADYECSVGVKGTGFFRAPEILRACKERNLNDKPELFSKAADVYSFGMTCYEILTGKLPFEGHEPFEYNLVLEGPPLEVPEYVDNWMRKLLSECWQSDPEARPSIAKILDSFVSNSAAVQGSSSMHKFVPHTQVHWSHPKTEVFTRSELKRQYRAMVYRTTLESQTLATELEPANETSNVGDEVGRSEMYWSVDDDDVEVEIERSKILWSEFSELDDDYVVAEENNMEAFKALQRHPRWGDFFKTFGERADDAGEMQLGEKFAEGGEAELYFAQVKWRDPNYRDKVQEAGVEYVLKVFRKGTFLRDLQLQWPQGMLQWYPERREHTGGAIDWAKQNHTSNIVCGTLLEDGRFAFLLQREQEDLRSLMDRCMKRTPKNSGPFSKEVAERFMHDIALGMQTLHSHDIVHRDLKASNVLIRGGGKGGNDRCLVADFECSLGVVGTGFFRAPEILHAIKDKKAFTKLEVFSKKSDVYSYGMVCYEILTGKLPFEGHPTRDFDLVLNGGRPLLPEYVDDWACELVRRCWHSNPGDRPSFEEILNLFSAHCAPMDEDWQEGTEHFIH